MAKSVSDKVTAEKAKTTEKAKTAEKEKAAEKAKTTEKAKAAEKGKSAEKEKTAEKAKTSEKAKTAEKEKAAEKERAESTLENDGFFNPAWYTNRELSWLDFNYRILDEARDKTNPLFERMKFLSITASNLDEFFMVRVASLMDMVHAKVSKPDLSGLTAEEQLLKVEQKCHELIDRQYSTLSRSLIPALRNEGYDLVTNPEVLNEAQKEYLKNYFNLKDKLRVNLVLLKQELLLNK